MIGIYRCWNCSQKNRVIPKGKNHGSFKHGICNMGYYRITDSEVNRVLEHRSIFEKHIGRKLTSKERVHHIDYNKLNNSIDNLYLCSNNSDHIKINSALEKCGIYFLNERIWFDRINKIYTTTKIVSEINNEPTVELPAYAKRIHIKKIRGTPYAMFLSKRHVWNRYHIAVIESFVKRKIRNDESVHHINENTIDNSINNLCLLTKNEHQAAHVSLRKCTVELFKEGLIVFKDGEYKVCII